MKQEDGLLLTDNSTSQHLPVRQPDLISFANMVRDWAGQRNAADARGLDLSRALNQIAHDILVDKMETCRASPLSGVTEDSNITSKEQ